MGIKASSANGVDVTKISCTRSGASGGSSYAVLGVSLGDGNDSITYDNATGQAANSALLMLGSGNDKAADDTITVGTDAIVFGDDGNDTVHLGARSDAYIFTGDDTVYADGADSSVYAGPDNGTVYGGLGDDIIYGNDGNDTLYGNGGDDVISGDAGNDKLYGGPGRDKLSGGTGTNVVLQD
ncbi:calcium-binding protein [Streptomyces sp. NPDC051576]|uniref:calcium-binding protein n=1 Tax=Streptomyces sp. NPDC051576 TaxID=3155803 RepID=UPI0034430170